MEIFGKRLPTEDAEKIEEFLEADRLNEKDKANIILLYEKAKPASEVTLLFQSGHESYTQQNFKDDVNKVLGVLKRLLLPHILIEEKADEDFPFDSVSFLIGKDEESLQNLISANKEENGVEKDRKRGRALGFPESAIEGYIGKKIIRKESLPTEVQQDPVLKFVNFGLSMDHWQEELEAVRKQVEVIKQKAPKLYDQIINS